LTPGNLRDRHRLRGSLRRWRRSRSTSPAGRTTPAPTVFGQIGRDAVRRMGVRPEPLGRSHAPLPSGSAALVVSLTAGSFGSTLEGPGGHPPAGDHRRRPFTRTAAGRRVGPRKDERIDTFPPDRPVRAAVAARDELFEHDPRLEPGERRAEAEVRRRARTRRAHRTPTLARGDRKRSGSAKHQLVAVRGAEQTPRPSRPPAGIVCAGPDVGRPRVAVGGTSSASAVS